MLSIWHPKEKSWRNDHEYLMVGELVLLFRKEIPTESRFSELPLDQDPK